MNPFTKLTPRQRDVARLITRGLNPREIAAHFDFSIKTFSTHRGKALEHVGARNNVELVLLALQHGEVNLPDVMTELGARHAEADAELCH